ncbi:hypothetical protein NQ318_015894 [Aromia moschata]|uniref:Uncharacterized protein n=1 Tax=Aromia moschata TaxID=1265417 RepID=A0AAV8XZY1_9CUCU|nr:hypothetical protein NQ318_015894 [Aromia moschata]
MNSHDFLLTNKDITYEIRKEIKRLGRPIPDLIISKTGEENREIILRNFNSSVYDRFKWLCVLKQTKLFCFICLVMGGNRSAWTQEGVLGKASHIAVLKLQFVPFVCQCEYPQLAGVPVSSCAYDCLGFLYYEQNYHRAKYLLQHFKILSEFIHRTGLPIGLVSHHHDIRP